VARPAAGNPGAEARLSAPIGAVMENAAEFVVSFEAARTCAWPVAVGAVS